MNLKYSPINIILTNHAKKRAQLRNISQSYIEQTLQNPDKTLPGKKDESVKFIKIIHNRHIHVVAKYLKDERKWLVLSCWVRGEEDKDFILDTMKKFFTFIVWLGKTSILFLRKIITTKKSKPKK